MYRRTTTQFSSILYHASLEHVICNFSGHTCSSTELLANVDLTKVDSRSASNHPYKKRIREVKPPELQILFLIEQFLK